jgi:hypothetical protein
MSLGAPTRGPWAAPGPTPLSRTSACRRRWVQEWHALGDAAAGRMAPAALHIHVFVSRYGACSCDGYPNLCFACTTPQADIAAMDSGRDSSEACDLPYIRALWNFHAFESAEFATGGPVYVPRPLMWHKGALVTAAVCAPASLSASSSIIISTSCVVRGATLLCLLKVWVGWWIRCIPVNHPHRGKWQWKWVWRPIPPVELHAALRVVGGPPGESVSVFSYRALYIACQSSCTVPRV